MKSSITFYSENTGNFELEVSLINGTTITISDVSFPYTFNMYDYGVNTTNGVYLFKKGRCKFIREINNRCNDDITITLS
jgi:hypothetical protein